MIRVLRVLEYTYSDHRRMAEDMDRWTRSIESHAETMRTVGELVTAGDVPEGAALPATYDPQWMEPS